MSEIVTLTMNPAADQSLETDHVVPDHKLRCRAPQLDPGGGGINVARTVRELGGRALGQVRRVGGRRRCDGDLVRAPVPWRERPPGGP